MVDRSQARLTAHEVCRVSGITVEVLVDIVDQGIVQPVGRTPEDWLFDADMIALTKKAARLHEDLELDWSGIALAIELLEEMERLRAENRMLRQRLSRFIR